MSFELRFDPASILLHSSLLLAVGLLAAAAVRKFGPSVRVAALRATLLGLIAVAVFGLVGIERSVAPAVRVSVPAQVDVPAAAVRRVSRSMPPVQFTPAAFRTEPPVPVDWRPWAIGLWGLGAGVLALRSLLGHLGLVLLRRRSRPASVRAFQMLNAVAGDRGPALAIADVASPFIAGVFRTTLYLHPEAEQADDETLRAILSHEVVHYRQRDCAWRALSTLACAALWPQPLAWWLARRLESATEDACDAAVVSGGASRAAYAHCLLSLAERKPLRGGQRAFGASVIPNRSHVGRRVAAILNEKTAQFGPASRRARFALGGLMLAVAAGATVLVATRVPVDSFTADSDPKAVASYEKMVSTIAGARSLSYTVETGPPGAMKTTQTVAYRAPGQVRAVEMEWDSLVPAVTRYLDGDRIVIESSKGQRYREIRRMTTDSPAGKRSWGTEDWERRTSPLFQLRVNGVQDEIFTLLSNGVVRPFRRNLRVQFDASGQLSVEWVLPAEIAATQKSRTIYALGPDSIPRFVRQSTTYNGGGDYVVESRFFEVKLNGPISDSALVFHPKPGATVDVGKGHARASSEAVAILDEMRKAYHELQSVHFLLKGAGGTMAVDYAKPNRAKIDVRYDQYSRQNLSLVADGKQMLLVNQMYPDRVLLTKATPEGIVNLGGAGLAMNLSDSMLYLQMILLDNPPRIDSLPFQLAGQATANGVVCDVIEYKNPFSDRAGFLQPGTYHLERIFVGRVDHMVRRIETENKFTAASPKIQSARLDFRDVLVNGPVNEETFQVVVPEGKKTFDSASVFHETAPMVQAEERRPSIGGPAPEVVSTTIDGKPFNLKLLRGKTVLVHAWTYGVSNQREDLPIYEAMRLKYGAKGLMIVGIPCEQPEEKGRLDADLKARKIYTTQLWDGKGREGGVQKALGLSRFPYSFIVRPDGTVFARDFFGKQIEPMVRAALGQ